MSARRRSTSEAFDVLQKISRRMPGDFEPVPGLSSKVFPITSGADSCSRSTSIPRPNLSHAPMTRLRNDSMATIHTDRYRHNSTHDAQGGSNRQCPDQHSTPVMMSSMSPKPAPRWWATGTACAVVDAAAKFGSKTANPSQKYPRRISGTGKLSSAAPVGPPCRLTSSGTRLPGAKLNGKRRTPSISSPSLDFQRTVRASTAG